MPLDTADTLAVRRTGYRLMWTFGITIVLAFAVVSAPTAATGLAWALTANQQLVLVAILGGALGGSIHVATSFADYVGNGRYDSRWLWWYALRPLIGSALALVFLCVMKAGWLPILGPGQKEVWGAAAISALVGLFSKQAVDKLDDVFDAVLKTEKDSNRAGSLEDLPTVATITGITPAQVEAGSGAQKVTLAGTGLPAKPVVRYAGTVRAAAYTDATRTSLEVSLLPEDVAAAGTFKITVADAAVDGDGPEAASVDFKVTARVQVGQMPIVAGESGGGMGDGGNAPAGEALGGQAGADVERPIHVPDEDESGDEPADPQPAPAIEAAPAAGAATPQPQTTAGPGQNAGAQANAAMAAVG